VSILWAVRAGTFTRAETVFCVRRVRFTVLSGERCTFWFEIEITHVCFLEVEWIYSTTAQLLLIQKFWILRILLTLAGNLIIYSINRSSDCLSIKLLLTPPDRDLVINPTRALDEPGSAVWAMSSHELESLINVSLSLAHNSTLCRYTWPSGLNLIQSLISNKILLSNWIRNSLWSSTSPRDFWIFIFSK